MAKKVWRGLALSVMLARLLFSNLTSRKPVSAKGSGAIVSLTSFGPRMSTLFWVVESIATGTALPDRLILWLDDETVLRRLPAGLRRLQRRGLEVRLAENLGPHTKYYPYVAREWDGQSALVTADDDVLYTKDWLERLLASATNDEVLAYRVHVLRIEERRIAPYDDWPACTTTEPSLLHLATGVAGVYYPPSAVGIIKRAGDAFRRVCPYADDIWLHHLFVAAGIRVRQLGREAVLPERIPLLQRTGLWRHNVAEKRNDRYVEALYSEPLVAMLEQEQERMERLGGVG